MFEHILDISIDVIGCLYKEGHKIEDNCVVPEFQLVPTLSNDFK